MATAPAAYIPSMRSLLLVIILASALGCGGPAAPARGATGSVGPITVSHLVAWGLPAAASLTVGLHLTHEGAEPDTLEGAQAGQQALMLHDVIGGRMVMLDLLEVAPGGSTVLGTGGVHLMGEGVPPALWDAGEVAVTFRFRRAGSLTLRVPILNYSEAMRELRR